MSEADFRIEKDSLGEMRVPADALWGASTQRAVENFPISGLRFPRAFIAALGIIKQAAAETNAELGELDPGLAARIAAACDEVIRGDLDRHFVLDIFQTGSGTSTNMNANEVIANRAGQLGGRGGGGAGGSGGAGGPGADGSAGSGAGGPAGATGEGTRAVHPNDHVNMAQSSNDVIPTAMQVAAVVAIERELLPALGRLEQVLEAKAREFAGIVKSGRTHLMDATPVRLGQEFGGYAAQLRCARARINAVLPDLAELPLGGTAVGTGINTHPEFPARTIARIASATGCRFREAENHFERQATRDTIVYAHGALQALAVSLSKIANDLRLLASGPRTGIAEITLPAIQPGSSIMPGKVNPVIPEAVTMVAAQVIGNHATITVGGLGSYLELNVMMPVMAYALDQSIALLARAADVFAEKCITGITANAARCTELLEGNLSLATALAPAIGYDAAADIAKTAFREGKTARQVAEEKNVLGTEELGRLLDPMGMTGGNGREGEGEGERGGNGGGA